MNTILLNQIHKDIVSIIYDVADYAADEARNNGIRKSAISPLNAVEKVRISLSEAIENTEKATHNKFSDTVHGMLKEAEHRFDGCNQCSEIKGYDQALYDILESLISRNTDIKILSQDAICTEHGREGCGHNFPVNTEEKTK